MRCLLDAQDEVGRLPEEDQGAQVLASTSTCTCTYTCYNTCTSTCTSTSTSTSTCTCTYTQTCTCTSTCTSTSTSGAQLGHREEPSCQGHPNHLQVCPTFSLLKMMVNFFPSQTLQTKCKLPSRHGRDLCTTGEVRLYINKWVELSFCLPQVGFLAYSPLLFITSFLPLQCGQHTRYYRGAHRYTGVNA